MDLTLLIADHHALIRSTIGQLLEAEDGFRVVAKAGSGVEAVELARQTHPQVAILDTTLPDGGGIVACQRIVTESPETSVLILSAEDLDLHLAHAWMAGAAGFIPTTVEPAEFLEAIRQVAGGKRLYSRDQIKRVRAWQEQIERHLLALSPRERDVLRLILDGKHNREIADALHVSEPTVEKHVKGVMNELGVHSRVALLALVRQQHLDVWLIQADGGDPPCRDGGKLAERNGGIPPLTTTMEAATMADR